MSNLRTKAAMSLIFVVLMSMLGASGVDAQTRVQAGVLACKGEDGWGVVIASKKVFQCTFSSSSGEVRGEYRAVIRKFGVDVGKTGATSLLWLVFGPAAKVGEHFAPGSLEGSYGSVSAEASVGLDLGANALVGGGRSSFALQPVSVQVQTGLSIAAGVESLELEYLGPLST